jgi:collagen type IV alpha-3-binding protein
VLDYLDTSTCIMYYLHKRVWPTAQRDSCVLCHIRNLGGDRGWISTSFSVDHEKAPEKHVRIKATIVLSARTIVKARKANEPLTRDHLVTEMSYLANIDPGGWAPAAVVK